MPVEAPSAPVAAPAKSPIGSVDTPPAAAPQQRPSMGDLIQKAADKSDPKPAKPQETPKPSEAKKDVPAKPTEAKKEEPKSEPAKATPETKTDAPKPKVSDLLHQREKRVKELEAELEKARSSKPEEQPETKAIIEERDRLKKRTQELEDEFRFVNYEKSTEFQEKYLQPYENLQKQLTSEAQELFVDGADGSVRALTADEFWDVATQPDLNSAVKAARNLFPDDPTKVNILIDFRKQIKRSWQTLEAAKQEFRTKGAEREKQLQSQRAELDKSEVAERQKEIDRLTEAEPDLFKAGEDEQENALRNKSEEAVDAALFGDKKPNPKLAARIRQAAVAFPILKSRYKAALATIESLNEKIAGFEKSIPGAGQVEGQPEVKEMTMADKIAARAR